MGIIFLSPQLLRLHGHYGLSYVVFFPLFLLLVDLLLREEKRKALWALCTGVLIVVMSLTHMYFLLLSAFVLFCITIFWWIKNRHHKTLVKSTLPLLLAALLLPGIFLVSIRKWTDPVHDRPVEPWGIDEHTISFNTTFFSFISPFDKAWTQILDVEKPITEKIAYVGVIGLLMLPFAFLFMLRKHEDNAMHRHIHTLLWAALLTWCMGAGIVYQNGFRWLWESIPVLKQFRGLGRFGIPFYYLYLLACSYLLWTVYTRLRDRELSNTGVYLLSGVFLIWGFEAWLNMKAVSAPVFRPNQWLSHTKKDYVPLLQQAGYTPDSFQAILQFPLVAIGNETFGVARGFWTFREGVHASTETGLPMIDYAMSRTSLSQGADIIELISTPYSTKQRGQLLNDKPILLVCEEEFIIPAEKRWIDQAKKIGTYQTITLYALPSQVFKQKSLPMIPAADTIGTCEGWFLDFEQYPCDTTMSGKGALPIKQAPYSIWNMTDTASTERQWIVSFWSRVDNVKGAVPVPRMMETGPDGTVLRNTGMHRESIAWAEAYGHWLEINFTWNTLGKGYKYELFIDNTGPVIDNLLIRPAGDTCIHIQDELILYNNLPIPQR